VEQKAQDHAHPNELTFRYVYHQNAFPPAQCSELRFDSGQYQRTLRARGKPAAAGPDAGIPRAAGKRIGISIMARQNCPLCSVSG
jgi:hypothetical protein